MRQDRNDDIFRRSNIFQTLKNIIINNNSLLFIIMYFSYQGTGLKVFSIRQRTKEKSSILKKFISASSENYMR